MIFLLFLYILYVFSYKIGGFFKESEIEYYEDIFEYTLKDYILPNSNASYVMCVYSSDDDINDKMKECSSGEDVPFLISSCDFDLEAVSMDKNQGLYCINEEIKGFCKFNIYHINNAVVKIETGKLKFLSILVFFSTAFTTYGRPIAVVYDNELENEIFKGLAAYWNIGYKSYYIHDTDKTIENFLNEIILEYKILLLIYLGKGDHLLKINTEVSALDDTYQYTVVSTFIPDVLTVDYKSNFFLTYYDSRMDIVNRKPDENIIKNSDDYFVFSMICKYVSLAMEYYTFSHEFILKLVVDKKLETMNGDLLVTYSNIFLWTMNTFTIDNSNKLVWKYGSGIDDQFQPLKNGIYPSEFSCNWMKGGKIDSESQKIIILFNLEDRLNIDSIFVIIESFKHFYREVMQY